MNPRRFVVLLWGIAAGQLGSTLALGAAGYEPPVSHSPSDTFLFVIGVTLGVWVCDGLKRGES